MHFTQSSTLWLRPNPINSGGEFAQLMNEREKRRAMNAFSDKKPNEADRRWILGVLTVFADAAEVTFAQAVHAFKTGRMEALRNCHIRRLSQLNTDPRVHMLLKQPNPPFHEPILKELESVRKLANMSENDHIAFLRKAWSFALTVRHEFDELPPMLSGLKSDDADTTVKPKKVRSRKRRATAEKVAQTPAEPVHA